MYLEVLKCHNCGYLIKANEKALFCPKCGANQLLVKKIKKLLPYKKNRNDINSEFIKIFKENPYNLEKIEELILKGADIETLIPADNTESFKYRLYEDSYLGKGEKVQLYNLNPSKLFYLTPLHYTVINSIWTTSNLLIKMGANVNAVLPTSSHNTILITALHNRQTSLVRLLIQYGADVHKANAHGTTPLHLAAGLDYETTFKILSKGANINAINKHKITPLHIAAQARQKAIVHLLLKWGAKINIKSVYGTEIDNAEVKGSIKMRLKHVWGLYSDGFLWNIYDTIIVLVLFRVLYRAAPVVKLLEKNGGKREREL